MLEVVAAVDQRKVFRGSDPLTNTILLPEHIETSGPKDAFRAKESRETVIKSDVREQPRESVMLTE